MAMTWLDALGWLGSALLVVSIMQTRVLRFRVLNLVACLILVGFNAAIGVWSMTAMNVVLAAINVWFIVPLLRERRDDSAYTILEVDGDDRYLQHFLDVERAGIARFFPDFSPAATPTPDPSREATTAGGDATTRGRRTAYLLLRGHETVGVVVVRDQGGGVAQVELDYVTARYRDFTPGEFVYRRSGLFQGTGVRRILTPPGMVAPYYDRLGFTRDGDRWSLEVR